MKKFTVLLISSILLFGAAACNNDQAKTTADAPSNPSAAPSEVPSPQATQAAQNDAVSQTRRNQLNADIRAHEQRNNQLNDGKASDRSESALATEVRDKLEANIPNGHITVEAKKDGTVTVAGTVAAKSQLDKIPTLTKQIKGVKNVVVNVVVGQPKAK
ncbi:MAG: BON domain-containing protein [Rhizonema sp. PD38]|nr:BON domain-containing protein [Rhizonema sp. PD38]